MTLHGYPLRQLRVLVDLHNKGQKKVGSDMEFYCHFRRQPSAVPN